MPSSAGAQGKTVSGRSGIFEYRIRVEGKYELAETTDPTIDAKVVSELNGISNAIDDLISNEIETYLPSSVRVNRVYTRFRVGSVGVESVLSFSIGDIASILTIAEFLVKVTVLVFERLLNELRNTALVDIPPVKNAEIWATVLNMPADPPSSGNNSGLANSLIPFGRVLQIETLMLASAIVLLVIMIAVLVIRYGLF